MKKKLIDKIYIKIDLGMFARYATLAPKFCLLIMSNSNSWTGKKTFID